MTWIASSIFESTILQIKMTDNFKRMSQETIETTIAVGQLEKALEKSGKCNFPECEFVQFVPDEYYQLSTTGVAYYRLKGIMQSIYALRCNIDYNPPTFDWLDLSEFSSYPVVGADPQHQGVRIYLTMPHLFNDRSMIQAFQIKPHAPPKLIYTIDETTLLGTPTLWHEFLLVEKPLKNSLAIYDAHSGEKIREEILKPHVTIQDQPFCLRSPVVLVNKPREEKRKIVVSHDGEIWYAEVELDYTRLGHRTVAFNH